MREKLIELLKQLDRGCPKEVSCHNCEYQSFGGGCSVYARADHLIANGVTVQEWIPVTERLPEEDVLVLCIGARGGMFLGKRPWLFSDGSAYFSVPNSRSSRYATHWMPLPQPPKGE